LFLLIYYISSLCSLVSNPHSLLVLKSADRSGVSQSPSFSNFAFVWNIPLICQALPMAINFRLTDYELIYHADMGSLRHSMSHNSCYSLFNYIPVIWANWVKWYSVTGLTVSPEDFSSCLSCSSSTAHKRLVEPLPDPWQWKSPAACTPPCQLPHWLRGCSVPMHALSQLPLLPRWSGLTWQGGGKSRSETVLKTAFCGARRATRGTLAPPFPMGNSFVCSGVSPVWHQGRRQ